jgi:hypothetical protein
MAAKKSLSKAKAVRPATVAAYLAALTPEKRANWPRRISCGPIKRRRSAAGGRSLPLCSYPNYPKYIGGPPESAGSYVSAAP